MESSSPGFAPGPASGSLPGLGPAGPSSNHSVIAQATIRFRMLVSHFMSPAEEAKLMGYRDGEAQLSLEHPNKPAIFIILIDGSREEERSLRLRLGRIATEKVDNQHIVVVGNHAWMPGAMRKLADEFWPKVNLYQLTSDGTLELKAKKPLPSLMTALKAQRKLDLPVAGVPTFTGRGADSGLASETEADFVTRCARAEETKERLRGDYADLLKLRATPATFLLVAIQAVLLGLCRLWLGGSDTSTVLVQLGASVPPFVRDGDWWRLLSSSQLNVSLISGVLGLLVLLSVGTLLEKLLGTARFVTLQVLSGLGGALVSMLWPRSSLVLISVGASGAVCGLLGAGGVLALDPGSGGLPPAEVQRLRKVAIGGLITTLLLTLVPGVDRLTHLGGVVTGAVLMASGAVRPPKMASDGRIAESTLSLWIHRGVAAVLGLLLVASVALALVNGHPWQPDRSWKTRLDTLLGKGAAARVAPGQPGSPEAGKPAAGTPEATARRSLGDSGISLELPEDLGEASMKAEPGRSTVYEFGDISEKQQLLAVLVQKHQKPMRNKGQLESSFDQAVAMVKADKLRDDRITVLEPPQKIAMDGWPVMTFHIRMQETVQARGLVQARNQAVIVLWYVYTDLLPETVQLDLKRALHSLTLEGAAPAPKSTKPHKRKR